MSANIARRAFTILTGTTAALSAATIVTLQVAGTQTKVCITRVKLKRQSGAGANFTPRITSSSGAAATAIEAEWEGAATAVAALFDETDIGAVCSTDSTGALYLVVAPDAGADNIFKYAISLEILA